MRSVERGDGSSLIAHAEQTLAQLINRDNTGVVIRHTITRAGEVADTWWLRRAVVADCGTEIDSTPLTEGTR